MTSNTVYNKLVELAFEDKTFGQFARDLRKSTEDNPIRIGWTTLEGNNRYYFCFWDAAAYTPSNPATQTRSEEDMVALRVIGLDGDWRTITYDTVAKYRFEGRTYRIV